MDRRRVQYALGRRPADLAGIERVVREALHDVKGVALLAAVFVDRHAAQSIAFSLALPDRECQAPATHGEISCPHR